MASNKNPKCMCPSCNQIGTHKLPVRKRGGGNGFLCDYHWRNADPYSADNMLWIGAPKAHGFTASMEFETSYTSKKARIELTANGFRPTEDATVDVEYKSPCYNGFNALAAILPSLQDLTDAGDMQVGPTCGTHLHIGNREHINRTTMSAIIRFYHSLFVPVCRALEADPDKMEAIFGRCLGGWADRISTTTEPENHRNFINVQHPTTIEFRLCKFKSAEQYARAVKLCRELSEIIVDTFVGKYESLGSPSRYDTTPEQKAALKKAAEKAAKKMVRAFENA